MMKSSKRKIYRWWTLSITMLLILGLSSCGKKKPTEESESAETTAAETTAAETEPTDPWEDLPFGVQGLDLTVEERGDGLVKIGSMAMDARTKDGYYSISEIFAMDESRILFTESVRDTPWIDEYGDGDWEGDWEGEPEYEAGLDVSEGLDSSEETDSEAEAGEDDSSAEETEVYEEEYVEPEFYYETTMRLFNYKAGTTVKTMTLVNSNDLYQYAEWIGECLCVWTTTSDSRTAELYDMDLNPKGKICLPVDVYGIWGPDNRYYHVDEHKIRRFTPEKLADSTFSAAEEIPVTESFAVDSINGVVCEEDGTSYAQVTGIGSDLRSYSGVVVNLNTGELEYLNMGNVGYMYTSKNAFIYSTYSDTHIKYGIYTGGKIMEYVLDSEPYSNLEIVGDGKILVNRSMSDENSSELELILWDGYTGEMTGHLSLKDEGGFCYLNSNPLLIRGTEEFLIPVKSDDGTLNFYRWNPTESAVSEIPGVTVREAELPDPLVPDLEDMWNPANLTAKPISENLQELREQADALEEQMGCEIYIGTEVLGIRGGYAMLDCSDYETVEDALDCIEKEAGKYPDGFFAQICEGSSYLTGMDIYLTGTLKGTDEWSLDYAGGFRSEENNRLVLAIDCSYVGSIPATFHHEVCHAMETHISNCADWEDDVFGEAWTALNPEGVDLYTYDYGQFGSDETMQYAYQDNGWDYETAWVVDEYALTYPTEDRSRLFEYVMIDDTWIQCWESPHMKAKLDYMFELYREYFELGEEKTYWETVVG